MMTNFVLVPSRNFQQWIEPAKSETIGLGQENCHILHSLFRFKLTFRSRFVLGCCKTFAETSTKDSSAINRVVWKRIFSYGWNGVWTKFTALSYSSSFSRHCSARLSAAKAWDIIEKKACAAVVHGFSKPQTTSGCIYTNTFTSTISRRLS